MENDYKNRTVIIVIFVGILILTVILASFLIYQKPIKNQQAPVLSIIPTKIILPTTTPTGRMILKTKDSRLSYTVNQPIVIDVYADSFNTPVDGYDVVLQYDDAITSYVSIKSLIPTFSVSAMTKNGTLSATGFKNLADKTQTILSDTAIAEITFQPEKSGTQIFSFVFTPGATNDSNIISDKSRDLLSYVDGITIYIGKPFSLQLQKTVVVDTDVSMKLTTLSVPDERCMDCITAATITVAKKGDSKEIEFKTGGIAGLTQTKQEAFGIFFEQQSVTKNAITVTVTKAQ